MLEGPRRPFHARRLRYDATFALEVGWCSDHGLPHSALLEWSEEDRAKLVAYLVESAARCQMCGTASWEWEDDPFAYEAGTELCRGCMIKDTAMQDSPGGAGTRVVLVPKRLAQARRDAGAHRPARGRRT